MKSVHKLFSILENLFMEGNAGVAELNLKLGSVKSAIHRFLSVISKREFFLSIQSEDKPCLKIRYYLSP